MDSGIWQSTLQIESLETRAHDTLRFISSLRNTFQPVNRLPPEIISHIAKYILRDFSDAYPIIPLTHVCRCWRESIISTPTLWTLITCRRTHLAALSLERSKAAPLHFWLDVPPMRQDSVFCDLLKPYIQNIGALQFEELTTNEDLTQALPNFPQSTPNLRWLDLRHSDDEPGWESPSADPFKVFPDTLRSLSLFETPLYPSFLRLRTLTTLFLYYDAFNPPLDTILDFLEDYRSLEIAELVIDFPAPIPQRRTVTME